MVWFLLLSRVIPENDHENEDERECVTHYGSLKKVTDCAGEKGNAEQEQRPLHHGSFPTVSGAMSGLNLSGKRGFGWRARKSGSMISQNS